jgi:alpha-mannosidase
MSKFHKIHLVFSSHWDREWYLPFQNFRAKLVRILDEVLNALESGSLPFYQMDGQFIPVEDYLQIRPEKESLLRRLIAEGRFRVGPWYTLPDEFLVSGVA